MRIARVTTKVVDLPLERPFHPAWARGRNQPNVLMVVLEVDTDAGFRAMKLRFHQHDPREDLEVVEAIRAEVGDRIDLIVDANQAGVEPGHGGHVPWGFRRAVEIARELERLDVLWLEEPLPRHD